MHTFTIYKKFSVFLVALIILTPGIVSAHQPRIVEGRQTVVVDPEVSKAYYGKLSGTPDTFTIQSSTPFNLYLNILVPDNEGQKKDVSATVTKDGEPFTVLDGNQFEWKALFEPFGYDNYFAGPEYKANVEAGTYVVTVSSPQNDSKYSLAVGEIENFNFKETLNAVTLIPQLKTSFFDESPVNFILSPFGWGMIVILYVLAALFGFAYRFILKKIASSKVRTSSHNIGNKDRFFRFLIAFALLVWAITTNWSPLLIFFSGFALFESAFSWCGFYAAIGKSTCPID